MTTTGLPAASIRLPTTDDNRNCARKTILLTWKETAEKKIKVGLFNFGNPIPLKWNNYVYVCRAVLGRCDPLLSCNEGNAYSFLVRNFLRPRL